MIDRLLFYEKDYFHFYREIQKNKGKEIISSSKGVSDIDSIYLLDPDYTIIDVSVFSGYTQIQHTAEIIFPKYSNEIIFIADKKHKKLFEHEFRFCFTEFIDIEKSEDFAEIEIVETDGISTKKLKHKKVIDLEDIEIKEFMETFSKQLYGHEKFKKELAKLTSSFKIFNRLGEHKILSLFIMGDSGVGKTEVARALHKALKGKKKLAKINFGNYSSDNSLNSLIGSPRGYIGSDEGEIFIRVKNSDTGVILIDEFEKSNSTLFNYFLDVLENGKLVSSLAEEIDLNGFIIVFTSNISKDKFKDRISPELRSRFDYKGYFNFLEEKDKKKFVEFRVNQIIKKYNESYSTSLPVNFRYEVINKIRVNNYKNMRDLNKRIKDVFVLSIESHTNSLR